MNTQEAFRIAPPEKLNYDCISREGLDKYKNISYNSDVMNHYHGRKRAFTLAEVLITLGIIGVVAAMTISSVIQAGQKKAWVSSLKTTKSIIEQAHRQILAESGMDDIFNSGLTFPIDGKRCKINGQIMQGNIWGNYNSCSYNLYMKHLKVVKVRGLERYSTERFNAYSLNDPTTNAALLIGADSDGISYILANGAEVYFYFTYGIIDTKSSTNDRGDTVSIIIDVNGNNKKPNTFGRDIFQFYLDKDGHLIAQGSAEYAIKSWNNRNKTEEEALSSTYYWKHASNTSNNGCSSDKNYTGSGRGCAGRVLEKDKMDY